jgi:hypothetical protein
VRKALGDVRPELVEWWSWHDGAEVDALPVADGPGIYYRGENTLLEPWHVLSVDDAVRIRRWYRATAPFVGPAWVPVLDTDGAGTLFADERGALQILDEGVREQFASLREFVELAVRAFDAGAVRPSAMNARAPAADHAKLDGDLRRLTSW